LHCQRRLRNELLAKFRHVYYCTDTHSHEAPPVFILNPQSGIPIYRQLLEQVRRMVASGHLQPGTPLPSVRELAIKHAVNPMTISKAYSMLEVEGLLERNRGKPMTIAKQSRTQSQLPKRLQQLDSHMDQLILAARQLQLSEAEVIKALRNKWEETNE
jgi:GntR family transcriptional regulator